MRRKHHLWFVLAIALALVATACAGEGGSTTTTDAGGTSTTAATSSTTTTTRAPDPGFEGRKVDSGGCDYGGIINTIEATDEFTVQFNLCQSHPPFLAQIAFGVFGIQPEEHLAATAAA